MRRLKKNKKPVTNKMTVIRQMSFGKFCQAKWAIQHPDLFRAGQLLDMSLFEQDQLEDVDRRRFYITQEQRDVLDEFCDKFITKDPVEDMLKNLKRDGRFVTKPLGSTFVYDKELANKPTAIPQPANANNFVEITDGNCNLTAYVPDRLYQVYSDEERMRVAIKFERTPVESDVVIQQGLEYLREADMSQFLFVKDLNKPISTVTDIDFHVLFYMLETGKLNTAEAKLVFIKLGAEAVLDKQPRYLKQFGVPSLYNEDSTLLCAMLKAETFTYKYEKMLADGDPDEEYIFKRFKHYISNEIFPAVKHYKVSEMQYDSNIEITNVDINDKIVTITYDNINEGDSATIDVEYTSQDLLLNDFVCFEGAFHLDPEHKYNVWGEELSINDHFRRLYIEYPHGVRGGFFATMKEAYEAGAVCINEVA